LTDAAKAFRAEGVVTEMQEPTITMFKQSPKIATYLLAIVAGPYKHVEMNEKNMPPMKVYMRDSLMK